MAENKGTWVGGLAGIRGLYELRVASEMAKCTVCTQVQELVCGSVWCGGGGGRAHCASPGSLCFSLSDPLPLRARIVHILRQQQYRTVVGHILLEHTRGDENEKVPQARRGMVR